MTLSFLVTRRALALGAQDTVTGWYAKTYTETADYDKIVIVPKGYSLANFGIGTYAKYTTTGIICAPLFEDDEIIANARYYRVGSVEPVTIGDSHAFYMCELQEAKMHGDQPSTSGTWHLDSDATRTDPRYRMKTWLDGYLTAANIKEDDAATLASYITHFADPDYNIKRVFITKDVDLVFSIGKTTGKAKEDYLHKIYAFEESIPITISAINKAGLTGANVVEQAEQEIRHVFTDYLYGAATHVLGSIRGIDSVKHEPIDLGHCLMWSTTVTVKYERANDEYVPTTPNFDHGVAFTYEGDRLAGGIEGTWTLTNGGGGAHSTGTQTIDTENNLYLNLTAFTDDMYTTNGTNLNLNTTTYTQIRWRIKTTAAATAKIILTYSDATTQTVLAETGSPYVFTVGTATLTAIKLLDHISLYCCDGVGTVTYDFIEVYTGTYILPNVIHMSPPLILQEAVITVPSRFGSINQALGSASMEIRMTCDLDMEHTDLKWKRAQTGASTDHNNIDILLETAHRGGNAVSWVWLDLGDPTMQFKARLVEVNPAYSEGGNTVELVWREYRHGTAGNETTSERFGLNL
jgi:hypothetical protein